MSPFIFKVPPQLDFAEVQKIVASDGATSDGFGNAAAVSGTTIVIGVMNADENGSNSGAAYVFEKSGSVWNQVQKLLISGGVSNDLFGVSVSISGSTIVVGASGVNLGVGAAYVYEKSGTWPATETQKIVASDGNGNDRFGYAIAISGTSIAVGSYQADPGAGNAGAAYVYEKSGTWPATETQKIVASDGIGSDNFGYAIAMSGTTMVVGAYRADVSGNTNQGAAYVYEKSGTWTETQKLLASDGAAGDEFGSVVAITASTIVISPAVAQNAVYVFDKLVGVWSATETQKILAVSNGNQYGSTISVSGTTMVVGAFNADPGGLSAAGEAYIYEKSGTWPAIPDMVLTASDKSAGWAFGRAVVVDGQTLVVTANNVNNVGAGYVFSR